MVESIGGDSVWIGNAVREHALRGAGVKGSVRYVVYVGVAIACREEGWVCTRSN